MRSSLLRVRRVRTGRRSTIPQQTSRARSRGCEAFVEEGRWVHANLQAYVHHEPVDPGFSNRDAARWLRLAQHLRTDFGKRVLHEAFAQRLQGN
jgi:hypothetical protein